MFHVRFPRTKSKAARPKFGAASTKATAKATPKSKGAHPKGGRYDCKT
jgi:hypothetical protein